MANKKNKRLSLSSSSSSNKQTDIIERTPENDYGVLSDPDEVNDFHPEASPAEGLETSQPAGEAEGPDIPEQIIVILHESPQKKPSSSPPNTPPIQPQMPPSSPPEPLHQTSQIVSHPESATPTSSIDRLKLIISSDKKYEEKMTLHTFFSFVVMAMDLTSGGNVRETETLVEYLINNHSVNEYTKAYLHTLFETDVVKNIIQSILQFNNEHPDNFTKLVSSEQPQPQPQPQAADEPNIILADSPHPSSSPPSRIRSFFKRLFCCCCSHRRRRNSLPLPLPETSIVLKDTEMTPVVEEDAKQE
jgi:hypothetical protein